MFDIETETELSSSDSGSDSGDEGLAHLQKFYANEKNFERTLGVLRQCLRRMDPLYGDLITVGSLAEFVKRHTSVLRD